jgi:hypothetical protein
MPDPTPEAERELEPVTVPQAPEGATPDALLTRALAAAQAAFPPLTKSHTATVQGKQGKQGYSYQYADLADVLTAVRPVLAEQGLAITQRTVRDGANVVLLTELMHIAGGVLVSEVDLGRGSGDPQAFGGALTYLRRYELVTLLGLAAEEDRDAQDVPVTGNVETRPVVEVPAWAQPVPDATKADVLDRLARVLNALGAENPQQEAKDYLVAWAQRLDGIPVAVAGIIHAIAGDFALPPAPPRSDVERQAAAGEERRPASDAERRQALEERTAARAAEQAQRAAGEPDPAAPPVEDGPPADTAPASPSEPPVNPVSSVGARYDAWPSAADYVGAHLKAGTFGDTPADKVADQALETLLRDAGCTCEHPLNAPDEAHADDCPFPDHGIPF